MRRVVVTVAVLLACSAALAQRTRSVGRPRAEATTCSESALVEALNSAEVDTIVRAAARSLDAPGLTIAVVDRGGRPLALYRRGSDASRDDEALGIARTAAFFSHDMAPLSSRTVRFISGIHFPPGITNTPSAALYGIENTNRGCDFNATVNAGKALPRATSVNGAPCRSGYTSGCGRGIVTDGNGGIPLYRLLGPGLTNGKLIGAIGVIGAGGDADEYAAVMGAFGSVATGVVPLPSYPLPEPGNVFVDGIRLPFLGNDQRLEFNGAGTPTGLRRLAGTRAGNDDGTFVIAAQNGGCASNEYLVGPHAGSQLTMAEVDAIVQRAVATARRTRALIRLPLDRFARMVISVADVDGTLLALYRMPDATVFSVDVAVAKSRNVVWFSTSADLGLPAGTAVTNRTIGFGGQPFYPPGIDSNVLDPVEGPWYRSLYLFDRDNPCTQGSQPASPNQNGIVFFAGSSPLYRGNQLAGGLGVSGDGIEQDDYVTYHGAGPFLPAQEKWADRVKRDGVRLPMFKFPRQPEGVRE